MVKAAEDRKRLESARLIKEIESEYRAKLEQIDRRYAQKIEVLEQQKSKELESLERIFEHRKKIVLARTEIDQASSKLQ